MKQVRKNMPPPSSRLKIASVFTVEDYVLLDACFIIVSCLAFSSALKMEATCSSEMSVDFQWITRRLIKNTEFFITTAVGASNRVEPELICIMGKALPLKAGNLCTFFHVMCELFEVFYISVPTGFSRKYMSLYCTLINVFTSGSTTASVV
jgi:hypothetical protein